MHTQVRTWEELEMNAYFSYRMSEVEFVAKTYGSRGLDKDTDWVNESANPEFERYLMDAYDASMVPNPCVD